jgi:hypothetical protein
MQGAEKFRSAAYALYVSKKFFPQRSSWDEIWIFRGIHNIELRLGCGNTALTFFLKDVQYENRLTKLDRINDSVCTTFVILDNLQYASATKAFKNFSSAVLLTMLGKVQGMTEKFADFHRQCHQIFFAAT